MNSLPFAIYDAFSDRPFGGSQAGIVLDADGIDAKTRLQIAREFGLPAVCFVTAYSDTSITARFQSTEREYPMCGHGTICLVTHMIEKKLMDWSRRDRLEILLNLPTTTANVEIMRCKDDRVLVMLDIKPPEFRKDTHDIDQLAGLLGLPGSAFSQDLPIETAMGDFVHLVVPIRNLSYMRAIKPDFSGIVRYCREHSLETIACFCAETERADHDIHVRDFCPAVGVPESAAAGTTNAALTSYLIRQGLAAEKEPGKATLKAEQGLEIGRPSSIQSWVSLKDGEKFRLQVGGVAAKVLEGQLHLPGQ